MAPVLVVASTLHARRGSESADEDEISFCLSQTIQRALQNARSAELERDKALERSASLTVLLSKSSLHRIAVVRNQLEWAEFCASATFRRIQQEDYAVMTSHQHEEEWDIVGYSIPAGQLVRFHVDMLSGGASNGNMYTPNLRERLVCPVTHLNNRQRLIASLVSAELSGRRDIGSNIYFMEQMTPIYTWVNKMYGDGFNIIGSEFLGNNLTPRADH